MSHKRKKLRLAPSKVATQPVLPVGSGDGRAVFGICVFLVCSIGVVFGETLGYGFVNFDDGHYVYENPQVLQGLNLTGIGWVFTHSVAANWHPLTVLSHMLDCQFYGLHAGGHHLTNLLLQAATAILLFLVLREMTGTLWRSAFVAAVFAIHPLRVESVAWVSERKDVLSGLFFMLTLGAYVRYVRKPPSRGRYLAVWFLFALGLMCKPMLVTVPFVLLLLDYWPLKRFGTPANHVAMARKLIIEKIPLIVFSMAACGVTLLVQQPAKVISFSLRLSNALVSCVAYCGQMFYPAGLAVMYPYPIHGLPVGKIILSLLLLLAVTVGAFCWRQRRPYFLMGWLWYLGMLVPVIGLVQVGNQARADRYTYLPQIGLYVLLAWLAVDLTASWRGRRWVVGGGALVVLVVLIACARTQTTYWRDSESLWTRSLACTSDNGIAHAKLGIAFHDQGRLDEAITELQKAVAISPEDAEPHYNLGNAFLQQGRLDDATVHYQKALTINPEDADAHNNLGNAFLQLGRLNEAVAQFRMVLAINPDCLEAQNNLAWILATCSQVSLRNGNEAVKLAERANQLAGGDNPIVLCTLAAAYAEGGRFPEATGTAQRALQLAEAQSSAAFAGSLRSQLKLYQAGVPFHGTDPAP